VTTETVAREGHSGATNVNFGGESHGRKQRKVRDRPGYFLLITVSTRRPLKPEKGRRDTSPNTRGEKADHNDQRALKGKKSGSKPEFKETESGQGPREKRSC